MVNLFSLCLWSADHPPNISYLLKHAASGDIEAQFKLGVAFQTGSGVTQDFAQAAYWYQKAADQDHTEAKKALEAIKT